MDQPILDDLLVRGQNMDVIACQQPHLKHACWHIFSLCNCNLQLTTPSANSSKTSLPYSVFRLSWSARRCWKAASVRCLPSSRDTLGMYPSSFLARLITKRRCDAATEMRLTVNSDASKGPPSQRKQGLDAVLKDDGQGEYQEVGQVDVGPPIAQPLQHVPQETPEHDWLIVGDEVRLPGNWGVQRHRLCRLHARTSVSDCATAIGFPLRPGCHPAWPGLQRCSVTANQVSRAKAALLDTTVPVDAPAGVPGRRWRCRSSPCSCCRCPART